MAIETVTAYDVLGVVHLNATMPGSLLCSYYADTVRPVFASRVTRHAGHARVVLEGLTPETAYTVECSLHAGAATVHSAKHTFTTPAHLASHVEVADVEPFATYARIAITSDAPGAVRCLPMRPHLGATSLRAFHRLSQRVLVGARRRGDA